jgi:uncharacterized protein (DUF1684 family)
VTRPTPESEAALIAYIHRIEEHRARIRAALRGPTSSLAATARHELPVGATLRIGPDGADVQLAGMSRLVEVRATADGFVVDGATTGPTNIDVGRYNLRLSHQNYPAVVVLDRESPHLMDDVERRWWPIDPALRIRARVEPEGTRGSIQSTASSERAVEHVGWIPFAVDDAPVRMLVTRLLEPGSAQMDVYFRDGTTGHGSYEVGRYVDVERDGDDVIVDFNLAYNPACALSPYYNCPIPPTENRTDVPIRAGEMSPLVRSKAAHR